MAGDSIPCPTCGAAATRLLSRKELRDRSGGRDPLVVSRPRICTACGSVWEPPPSRTMCYVVAGLAGVGWLVGMVLVVGAFWFLIAALRGEGGGANTLGNRLKIAGAGLIGITLAGGSLRLVRKYIRLARTQASTRA